MLGEAAKLCGQHYRTVSGAGENYFGCKQLAE
jgi:hypothetical protein